MLLRGPQLVYRAAGYSGFDMHDLLQVLLHRHCSHGTRSTCSVVLLELTYCRPLLTNPQALLMSPCWPVAAGGVFWAAASSAACTQGAMSAELWPQDPRRPVLLRGFKVQRPGCFFAVSRC